MAISIKDLQKLPGVVAQQNMKDTELGGKILGSIFKGAGQVIKNVLPRTYEAPQKILNLALNPPGSRYPKPTSLSELGGQVVSGAKELAQTAIPPAGELGAIFSPLGPESTATSIGGKIISTITRFGPAGFIYGLTSPDNLTPQERLKEATTDAAFFSVMGPIFEKIMTSVGIGAAKAAYRPDVPESDVFGYIANQDRAVETTLKNTPFYDITSGSLLRDMGKKVAQLSNAIADNLGKVGKEYRWSNLETDYYQFLKEKIPTLNQKGLVDLVEPFVKIIKNLGESITPPAERTGEVIPGIINKGEQTGREIVGYVKDSAGRLFPKFKPTFGGATGAAFEPTTITTPSGGGSVVDFKFTLEGLNYARMAVYDFMSDVGAWEKLGRGNLSKEEQKIGVQTGFFLRDLINKEAKAFGFNDVGKALTTQSDLYRFANGVIDQVKTNRKPNALTLRSQLAVTIKYLFEPLATLIGRVGISKTAQKIAMLKTLETLGWFPKAGGTQEQSPTGEPPTGQYPTTQTEPPYGQYPTGGGNF